MTLFSKKITPFFLFAFISLPVHAELQPIKKIPVNPIAVKWNKFVDDLLVLSNQLIRKTPHTEKHRVGSYSNEANFYNETQYISDSNKTLTSLVQMERKNPDNVHSIEVYLRDKNGRITKDFSASYLTKHHKAPIQTLITLHYYNQGLHGFRVFDASHERIYETCKGMLNNKKVYFELDDNYGEVAEALEDKKGIMSTPAYTACFGGRSVDKTRLAIPKI